MASLSDVQAAIDDPVPFVRNNVDITLNMLEFAREVKPAAFIQISTDEVYGPSERHSGHKEWSPILPSNPYSASKAAQEALAIAWWRSYGVPVIITNTMNNFGEMQQPDKFPVIVQRKLAAGEVVEIHGRPGDIGTRHYLHSRNHADALLYILCNIAPEPHRPGEIDWPARFNIVGDAQLDNLELAEAIAAMMGRPLVYELVGMSDRRPGHDNHYGLDGRKLKSRGWSPPVSFGDSLAETIRWQTEHPEWISAAP
jgi:dTDP-glucose 4,6-dehydratase